MKRFIFLFLCLPGFSSASIILPNGVVGLDHVSGGVRYVDPSGFPGEVTQGRTFGDPSPNRTLPVSEKYRLPFNPSQSLNVGRTLTAAEIAAAAVALGAAAYGGCAAGTAIAKAAGLGTTANGSRTGCNVTDWLIDAGSEPSMVDDSGGSQQVLAIGILGFSSAQQQTLWASSVTESCNKAAALADQIGYDYNRCERDTGNWYRFCKVTCTGWYQTFSTRPAQVQQCPPSIDALNPAWSFPGGDPGPDGKCPTGRYNVATPAEAAARIAQYGDAAGLKPLAQDVLAKGGSIETASPRTLSGPASSPAQTTTKTATAANGTTSVVTTNTTNNYTYNGDTITQTTVTTINYPDGSTEVEEKKEETPDNCITAPESLDCIKLGDLPTDSPQWETKTISYQADSLGLPAACPAPWSAQLRGWTLSFSYQPACDVAPQIRLAVLALSSLGALLMIITTVRT